MKKIDFDKMSLLELHDLTRKSADVFSKRLDPLVEQLLKNVEIVSDILKEGSLSISETRKKHHELITPIAKELYPIREFFNQLYSDDIPEEKRIRMLFSSIFKSVELLD